MTKRNQYQITNDGAAPFVVSLKPGSRIEDTLKDLMRGPVPAPSLRRVSDHVFRLRSEGVVIETEFRSQDDEGQERFGVYHLKSRVYALPKRKPGQ